MVATEREVFIDVKPGLRIRFRRSEAPPPSSYAITLEINEEDRWTTVRLWDNADGVDQHHEHGYTRSDGKQAPNVASLTPLTTRWLSQSKKPSWKQRSS